MRDNGLQCLAISIYNIVPYGTTFRCGQHTIWYHIALLPAPTRPQSIPNGTHNPQRKETLLSAIPARVENSITRTTTTAEGDSRHSCIFVIQGVEVRHHCFSKVMCFCTNYS